jgi:uncharacterized protein YggE
MKLVILLVSLTIPLLAEGPASIKVLGVAEERVPPDQLLLSCTIRHTGENLGMVAKSNRERAAEVTGILRGLGLGEAELVTGSASFGEDTEYRDGRRIRLGYAATTSIAVTTDKLELYDKLWFELAKFPEVSIDSASFGLKDRSATRRSARAKALKAARDKASEMADVLEARIGAPLSIIENPQQATFAPSNISRNSIDMVLSNADRSTPLEPGLVSVVERVEATFELIE